jgi:diaminopimelate epimerase
MKVEFVKMEGLGNDFVIIEGEKYPDLNYSEFSKKCLDRHFGIGGDGLLVVGKSQKADIYMKIFNPDGSEAEMCGNGIRCVAIYARDSGMVNKDEIDVETLAGIKKIFITKDGVKVDMGIPKLHPDEIPVKIEGEAIIDHPLRIKGKWLKITCVSMGNPHAVIFMEPDEDEFKKFGPLIETHKIFPKKTNVEFVKVIDKNTIRVKVWERGAGPTLACGTGACASLVASHIKGLTERKADVYLPGGKLIVEWGDMGHVFMTGPANYVFKGIFLRND